MDGVRPLFSLTTAVYFHSFFAYRSAVLYRYGNTDILRYHEFATARRMLVQTYGRFTQTLCVHLTYPRISYDVQSYADLSIPDAFGSATAIVFTAFLHKSG